VDRHALEDFMLVFAGDVDHLDVVTGGQQQLRHDHRRDRSAAIDERRESRAGHQNTHAAPFLRARAMGGRPCRVSLCAAGRVHDVLRCSSIIACDAARAIAGDRKRVCTAEVPPRIDL
jgi:hypothetical protein